MEKREITKEESKKIKDLLEKKISLRKIEKEMGFSVSRFLYENGLYDYKDNKQSDLFGFRDGMYRIGDWCVLK